MMYSDLDSHVYALASMCAQKLGSNEIASAYAEKAVNADKEGHNENPRNRILYCTTLANLGMQNLASNDFQKAFVLFSGAILNYQSVQTKETNNISNEDVLKMYLAGRYAAFRLGKTNESDQWLRAAKAVQGIHAIQSK